MAEILLFHHAQGLTEGCRAFAGELRAALEEVLPDYMVPRHYLVVPAVPLSANGKVDVSALPAPTDQQAPGRPSAPQAA